MSNPICGDRVECLLNISNDRVVDAWIEVKGCALCKASASLLSDNLLGLSVHQVSDRTDKFLDDVNALLDGQSSMGEASLFKPFLRHPPPRVCGPSLALSRRGIESRNVRRGTVYFCDSRAFRPSSYRMVLKSSAPSSPRSDSMVALCLPASPLRSVLCNPLRSVVRSSVDRIDLAAFESPVQ